VGEAIRRYIGAGPTSLGKVQGSLPTFVRVAQSRLRPIVEGEGIFAFPGPDLDGEVALLTLAEELP
jgi:hypothetical protein